VEEKASADPNRSRQLVSFGHRIDRFAGRSQERADFIHSQQEPFWIAL